MQALRSRDWPMGRNVMHGEVLVQISLGASLGVAHTVLILVHKRLVSLFTWRCLDASCMW